RVLFRSFAPAGVLLGPAAGEVCPIERYGSERVPGRSRRELEIADIGAQAQADAGANRNHDDAVRRQRGHSEAADEIGRTVDAGEALVDGPGGGQAVDEHHSARALAAEIPAHGRALPEHPQVAGVLGVENSLAVTQPS